MISFTIIIKVSAELNKLKSTVSNTLIQNKCIYKIETFGKLEKKTKNTSNHQSTNFICLIEIINELDMIIIDKLNDSISCYEAELCVSQFRRNAEEEKLRNSDKKNFESLRPLIFKNLHSNNSYDCYNARSHLECLESLKIQKKNLLNSKDDDNLIQDFSSTNFESDRAFVSKDHQNRYLKSDFGSEDRYKSHVSSLEYRADKKVNEIEENENFKFWKASELESRTQSGKGRRDRRERDFKTIRDRYHGFDDFPESEKPWETQGFQQPGNLKDFQLLSLPDQEICQIRDLRQSQYLQKPQHLSLINPKFLTQTQTHPECQFITYANLSPNSNTDVNAIANVNPNASATYNNDPNLIAYLPNNNSQPFRNIDQVSLQNFSESNYSTSNENNLQPSRATNYSEELRELLHPKNFNFAKKPGKLRIKIDQVFQQRWKDLPRIMDHSDDNVRFNQIRNKKIMEFFKKMNKKIENYSKSKNLE